MCATLCNYVSAKDTKKVKSHIACHKKTVIFRKSLEQRQNRYFSATIYKPVTST